MSLKEMAYRIDELQFSSEKIHSLQNTLYAAIYRQNEIATIDFEWAFIVLGDMTTDIMRELTELRDTVFGDLKKETV